MDKTMRDRIKSAAYAKGMNCGQLAAACGVTKAHLSTSMNGGKASNNLLTKIASVLGVSTDWLKNGDEGMTLHVMLDDCAVMPTRAHEGDAGLDLYMPLKQDETLFAHDSLVIDTGVHIAIPKGYVGMLKSKSGLNVKYGITSEGVIDSGYTGSICVKLYNNSDEDHCIHMLDKISQLVILPIITPSLERVDALTETERGENGFGSTGW